MTRQALAVSVVIDGCRYDGFYALQSNMLTVWSPGVGSRSVQLHGRAAAALAEDLLGEVIVECGPHRSGLPERDGWRAGELPRRGGVHTLALAA